MNRRVKMVVRRVALIARFGGRRFWCPVCDRRFRKFLPYNGRPNTACPNCGSRQRHRLLALYLDRAVKVGERDVRVLHGSPELGLGPRLKNLENLAYTSFDLCRPGVDVHGDLHQLPFRSSSVDLVLSSHVLEHVDDDRRAMREIRRVMNPRTGSALVLVPVDYSMDATFEDPSIDTPEGQATAFGQRDHVRLFGRDVKDRLAESGLVVTAIDYAADLEEREALSIRAEPGVDLIYECHCG